MHVLKQYENLIAAGVIDPTKVTRVALENAASIAGMLLTTECVVADKPEPKSAAAPAGCQVVEWVWIINNTLICLYVIHFFDIRKLAEQYLIVKASSNDEAFTFLKFFSQILHVVLH